MIDFEKVRQITEMKDLMRTHRYAGASIPEYMWGPLAGYLIERNPVGGFLTAVLENNLSNAALRADSENVKALAAYATFLHAHAPMGSYGSREQVKAWLRGRDDD